MTKICFISDTHGRHLGLQIPDADILVHCGDFSGHGTYLDALKFVNWFGAQPHQHKIFIAGNHDLYFEQGNPVDIDYFLKTMPPSVVYLNDNGCDIGGIRFWGSPVQPRFFNWAFNRDRGEDIKKHWDLIPEGIDVLITHGPAKFYRDEAPRTHTRTEHVGCEDLLHAIRRVKPKIHAFGHIHYAYGNAYAENVHHFNASICNENYIPCNKPFLVDLNQSSVNIIDLL
jgi:Icc-related predicted phosphoesterase